MKKLARYLHQRARLLGVLVVVACGLVAFRTRAPTPDKEGVRAALGRAADLDVRRYAWEPSRGPLLDFVLGRAVLFEGAAWLEAPDPRSRPTTTKKKTSDTARHTLGPRDIYRSFIRLSPNGQVLDVGTVYNLTRTRSGDESDLQVVGRAAVFRTQSKGSPPSLSLLNLEGEPAPARSLGIWDRVQLGLARYVETGTFHGLGRTDIVSTETDTTLQLRVSGDEANLVAQRGENQNTSSWKVGATPPKTSDAWIIHRRREALPWMHFAANTGRRVLGNDWIAWAEGRYFSTQDALHRLGYTLSHGSEKKASPRAPHSVSKKALSTDTTVRTWPPARLITDSPNPSDGSWHPIESELFADAKPPYFYRTVLHPDEQRPYAELHLVAMDMRRLELGIGAGYEDPEPDSGPPGSGQIPDDPKIFERVVATFNGAFKATHGRYGMKSEGRVLVEPKKGAATVIVDREGRVGLGRWNSESSADEVRALRQNLDPLVADGKVNPSGRAVWGDHLYGSGVAVERSALCLHESGHLIYAWALEATGETLARGLSRAGCQFAIHLDMNPGHCAFLFNHIESIAPLRASGEVLDPRMKVNATRFVRWSPKDFFYLYRRAEAQPDELPEAFSWSPVPGQGPPPKSVPAAYLGHLTLGALEIELERVDMSRFDFVVHPSVDDGRNEPEMRPLGLDQDDQNRVLTTWSMGHSTLGNQSGLTYGRNVLRPLRRTFSSLVLEDGAMKLLPPSEPLAERAGRVIVQLPTAARDGKLLPQTRELGGKRGRSALCFKGDQHLFIGRLTHDTIAPLVHEMLALGCDHVVELDRGSHSPIVVERAGTDVPPHVGHEQTVLYALSREMSPKTYTF